MQNVIVGIDGGSGSKVAARKAANVAEMAEATLHFVTVIRRSETTVVDAGGEQWFINSAEEAEKMVKQFVGTLAPAFDYKVHTVTGDAADGLLAKASEVDADLIVVGNHRMQGLSRILGSVGSDVLQKAPCDVLIVRST